MVTRKKVAIIGAGVSGLAAARVFKDKGHDITVIERSHDLGGVWEPSRSYPDVQTQSPKDLYRFTDKPMPDAYPEWPKGPQVHAYLDGYAGDHRLRDHIRFKTAVVSMARRDDGAPGWKLEILHDGETSHEEFDFVAVCTGQFSEKNILTHPGQDAFEEAGGSVMHSSEYTDPETVTGKDVVVLGFSKSATDIAVHAANNGAKSVTIVYLESVWRIPYFIGGLINFKRILYIRKQENMFQGWGLSAIDRFKYAIAAPFIWANWRALESLLTMQLKLNRTGLRPKTRIEDGVNCSVPIVTPGFFDLVASGRIKAIQGTFKDYEPGHVNLTGGETVPADVAILAVGWKLGVPFLAEEYRKKLVEPDGQYRLYRIIANPDLPDMGFVGFNSSFCTVLSAEMAANWLVRYADGMLENQPSDEEMRDNIDMMLDWRRNGRPAAQVYGGLCSAPFHFMHFDELLADMGAKTRKRNPLAENLAPPNADAYARFLATTPDYTAA
ncbi:flavin-containing monooxygenase [Hoeflea poritis]|uniref:Trimethylamine monooxygenase n=1 Tax=Hoeflea poritis TaxID=2993659 RepID=A0ABT4VH72_9HYPH|nr:NAD(P)/FAD-dependent oxidoreductase [Hoeflea poritis]MDA4844037.1 NAD(P)/FAD-dependent oxidoreductase [Hoeflea poritis]